MKRSIMLVLCVVLASAAPLGCGVERRGPYTVAAGAPRNPLEAQRLTQEAMTCIDRDAVKAEKLLRRALDADIFHGPAHNNLGVLLLARGELHLAAQEFQFARTLMPGHPDPRLNLGVTLERAGRTDDALGEYRSALEVLPGHIPSLQAMTRCRLRHKAPGGGVDSDLVEDLREIAVRGDSAEWREWAQRQLAVGAD